MQTDIHYYGTYAMARCAGIRSDIALAIATAAEYVDDSDYVDITLKNGERVRGNPTAHHPMDANNLNIVDQRQTWIPFHFVPGNVGGSVYERLRCQVDSPIAREMVTRNVGLGNEPFGIVLLGITAHVYADTFAHYGFSGITSIENHVAAGSIELDIDEETKIAMRKKENEFIERYIRNPGNALTNNTDAAAVAADWVSKLGHAGVATYPDQPFLKWRFTYGHSNEKPPWRDNPSTFLAACRSLYQMFKEFHNVTENDYLDTEQRRSFAEIEPAICGILATVGDVDVRIAAWRQAVVNGSLYVNPSQEEIPRYDLSSYLSDTTLLPTMDPMKAKQTEVYDFIVAANNHRAYMNDDLLPKCDLPIADTFIKSLVETIHDWI
jgi:hypothetical protein